MVFSGAHLVIAFFYGILCVIAFLFWLWMLVDVVLSRKPFLHTILWVILMFLLPLVGSIIYFLVGRSNR